MRNGKDRLTQFLYILMRDEVVSGAVERIMVEHVEPTDKREDPLGILPVRYSNRHLYGHAQELANRLIANSDLIPVIEVEMDCISANMLMQRLESAFERGCKEVIVRDDTEDK